MNETTKKLTTWAIEKIKTEYPQDVALLIAVEGHEVNGDGHGKCFDYFVPATPKGNDLAQAFVIGKIGYDLYPRSWERLEATANLEDTPILVLGNASILYRRSEEEEKRFFQLRQKLFDNLSNKTFVYRKALENLDVAMDLFRTMMFEEKNYQVKMATGYIVHYLSLAITFLNGTYEKDLGQGSIPSLQKLANRPENFIEYYQAITTSNDINDLKNLAHLIISTTRKFIASYKEHNTPLSINKDFSGLANWYQELCLWWHRLYYYCDNFNVDAVFREACSIQGELNIVKEEYGLKEMDLLSSFDAKNLTLLSQRALELEKYIVLEIQSHGASLAKYETLEDFLRKTSERISISKE